MEIGNQIRSLRQQRGITQETLAEKLGVSPQAVSKWERDAAMPDIQLLPAISAYFGVTIDELFELSDETRIERIQNMMWDEYALDPKVVEREEQFLLQKGRKEQKNDKVYTLLADIEFQLAEEHLRSASGYALEAIRRNPEANDAHSTYVRANRGAWGAWLTVNHHELIDFYKKFVEDHPHWRHGYQWLLEQLIDDCRFEEAHIYCEGMAKIDDTFRTPLYRTFIALAEGNQAEAEKLIDEMKEKFADDWHIWLQIGDIRTYQGRYEEALGYYRLAIDKQTEVPRYTDGTTSIAHVCEILGDWDGAIEAHEEELNIIATDWNCTSGETVDQHHREIARLRAKKEQS